MEIYLSMSTTLNSVYDVIEALCRWYGFTTKDLAMHSRITYSTLATIMKKRPAKIAAKHLEDIGKVFGVEWYKLLGHENEPTSLKAYEGRNVNGERVNASMDEEAIDCVLNSIIGDDYTKILDRIKAARYALENNQQSYFQRANGASISSLQRRSNNIGMRSRFDSCVDMVFDNFNDAGVVEAMRYILALSQDPKYCKSSDSSAESETLPSQEDTL